MKNFVQIDFDNLGHPEIMIRIFSFLAQEPVHKMALKKGRQMLKNHQGITVHKDEMDRQLSKRYPTHRLFEVNVKKLKLPDDNQVEMQKVKDLFSENDDEQSRIGQTGINFKQYVNFFKTFCRMPGEHEREVREALRK